MPDLYFYRDPQETEKEEAGEALGLTRDEPMVHADQQIDFTQAVDVQNWADEPTSWSNDKAPVGTQDWGVATGGASQW